MFLEKQKKVDGSKIVFDHLLVAHFNLQERFIALIDREILNAKKSHKAKIIIKLNNLEEERLIDKLYEASIAGVNIQLIVRSICSLVPGVEGMSENIPVRRIVDRYLEHGRVFWFYNKAQDEMYLGSADWMNRNIYHRIEVCFPVYDVDLKNELKTILQFSLEDNVQAVELDDKLKNVLYDHEPKNRIRSQEAIYEFIQKI